MKTFHQMRNMTSIQAKKMSDHHQCCKIGEDIMEVPDYSPSPIISISILGLRSQNAYMYIKAKAEVSPKHMLI